MDDADDRTDSYLLACLDAAPEDRRRSLAELRANDPDQARRVGKLLALLDEVGFLDDAPRSRPDCRRSLSARSRSTSADGASDGSATALASEASAANASVIACQRACTRRPTRRRGRWRESRRAQPRRRWRPRRS